MSAHPQYTVATPVALEGVGLHTGRPARVTISPSEQEALTFIRNGQRIAANVGHVSNSARCTRIGEGDRGISTVEHLLASLSAFSVTGAVMEVEGPEIPILDGSAAGFVAGLRQAGLRPLPGSRSVLEIREPIWLEDGASSLLAVPATAFRVTACVSYRHPLVGTQMADVTVDPFTFERDVAPARTFGFEEELEELARRGLAQGGTLDNALVFFRGHTSSPLRFPDEPVRHKVLDVIGDLSLIGALPLIHIWAIRPSHRLNTAFARLLLESGVITKG